MLTCSLLETYKAVTEINTDYNDFVCILLRVSSMSSLSWVDLKFQTSSQCQSLALDSIGGPAVAFLCIVCTCATLGRVS
jgi:hypothetical protein